jgi:hypothetical protein
MNKVLPQIIGKVDIFQWLFTHRPEIFSTAMGLIGDRERECMNSMFQCNYIFKKYSPQECVVLLISIKEKLPQIINNFADYKELFNYVSPHGRDDLITSVLQEIKTKLPKIIKDYGFLRDLITHYHLRGTEEQLTILIKEMGSKTSELLKKQTQLEYLLQYLTPTQSDIMLQSIRESLPRFIGDVFFLNKVLKHLTSEQQTQLLEKMISEKSLDLIIDKPFDFQELLAPRSPEQRDMLYRIFQGKITSSKFPTYHPFQLTNLLRFLSPTQCEDVCYQLRFRFPIIIKSILRFNHDIMGNLSFEQKSVVFDELKGYVSTLIKTPRDFEVATGHLEEKQCLSLCEQIHPLHGLVQNATDFKILDNRFKSDIGKTEFRQLYFKSLLCTLTAHHLSTHPEFGEHCKQLNLITEGILLGQTPIEHFNTTLTSCKAQIPTDADEELLDKWEYSVKSISDLQTSQTEALESFGVFGKRSAEKAGLPNYSEKRNCNL